MRTIERSSTFKRDYKRDPKAIIGTLDSGLNSVLVALANDSPLDARSLETMS